MESYVPSSLLIPAAPHTGKPSWELLNINTNTNEKYKAILDYDIFIFDFDGTIMDTEKYHHKAWEITLNEYFGSETDYDINLHYKYGHALKKNSHKDWLYYKYGIENYEELYVIKSENYNKLIHENKIMMISGVQEFLTLILTVPL